MCSAHLTIVAYSCDFKILCYLPVKVSPIQIVLQPTYPYQLPLSSATCCGRDFVPYCVSKKF